ncbi:MAG: transcriptional regulator [Planctomycetota bacterium]
MQDHDFQNKLNQLIEKIDELPEEQRERLNQLASETQQRHDRIRKAMNGLQESLDYLRLSVKYLVFDLEATRRENDQLRGLLRGRNDNKFGNDNNNAEPSD